MISESSPKKIVATLGSAGKTRLMGGMLTGESSLPVKITVLMWPTKEGTDIEFAVEDTLGSGTRLGIKGKFEKYFQSLLNELSVLAQY
jgi:hypothetical protein